MGKTIYNVTFMMAPEEEGKFLKYFRNEMWEGLRQGASFGEDACVTASSKSNAGVAASSKSNACVTASSKSKACGTTSSDGQPELELRKLVAVPGDDETVKQARSYALQAKFSTREEADGWAEDVLSPCVMAMWEVFGPERVPCFSTVLEEVEV